MGELMSDLSLDGHHSTAASAEHVAASDRIEYLCLNLRRLLPLGTLQNSKNVQIVAAVAGHYATCTALQLRTWQRGFRGNSPEAMALFAKNLDGQEIAAVAAYYQQARGAAAPSKQ